jgi:hypothetical protein
MPPEPIAIRPLRPDDGLDDLLVLSRDFFAEYSAYHPEFFAIGTLQDSDITAYFARTLESQDAAAFLALRQGRVIGYITVFVRDQPAFYKVRKI